MNQRISLKALISYCSFLVIFFSLIGCEKKIPEDCIDEDFSDVTGCLTDWDPVCGCNQVTYGNDCEARNAGVLSWEEGECN